MIKKVVTIDLDGVLAIHPIQKTLVSLRKLKEKAKRQKGTKKYYLPQSKLEQSIWILLNDMKSPPTDIPLLEKLKKQKNIRLILVSNRFSFLKTQTHSWLKKYNLESLFDKIYLNTEDEDLYKFKQRIIEIEKPAYHIDDEVEICDYLANQNNNLKILLIGDNYQNEKTNSFKSLSSALSNIDLF